ncbi:PAAR domain-containing protein [Pseudomonas sp. PSKL.D1]|uniref:PAAR domain-containing protein n=1 Tax=Pseudomonas sp. PSKL.D1 TaxID=3029060 RepID=UPI003158C049
MRPVILVGHTHDCPIHGQNFVETGSPHYTFNGKAVARVGDRTRCDAVIISGSPAFHIKGESCRQARRPH